MTQKRLFSVATATLCGVWLLLPATSQAAKRHNLSVNFGGNAEHCSDLKATSTDGEIAQVNEAFTLQRSEAPILELAGIERGIFQFRGWDRAEYSVEACKIAVAADRGAAETMLRGVSVSRSAGRISSTGPTSEDSNWQVYFIVRTPRGANLSVESRNGPISLADVDGSVKVRAVNGPVSVRNPSGTTDVLTTNGPISLNGGSGEVRLHANNGPISVELSNDVWNGSVLEAKTQNGPVSLNVPDTFRSGVRVESAGRSPVSCRANACQGAWTNAANDMRVLQLNGSQDTIRVTTTNGPVSVGPVKVRRII